MSESETEDPIELDVGVLDEDGSLTVWRHHLPWASAAATRRVQGFVVEALRVLDREDLVERVLMCDDAACEEAAGLVARSANAEWAPSCMWLSIRLQPSGPRSVYARIALSAALSAAADETEDPGDPGEHARLSAMCSTLLATAQIPFDRHGLATLISGQADRVPGRLHGITTAMAKLRGQQHGDDDREDRDAVGEGQRRLPRMRVLLEPIPDGMPDAKRMQERYAPLVRSLPLTPLPDPDAVEATLSAEFPWMRAAAERVAADIRLSRLLGARHFRCRPLLLVGPPSVGKSRFARRLAEAVGSPYGVIAAGGSSDSRSLSGTAAGWSTAMPSYPLVLMAARQSASPVVLVDEVDKAGGSDRNGRIHDALLGLIEPETARRWPDEALGVCADLSAVTWVLTANTTVGLPDALLTRLGVVEVGAPGPETFGPVLDGILGDLALEIGGRRAAAESLRALLEPEAVEALRCAWARSGSPRRLRALVQAALSAAAKAMHLH